MRSKLAEYEAAAARKAEQEVMRQVSEKENVMNAKLAQAVQEANRNAERKATAREQDICAEAARQLAETQSSMEKRIAEIESTAALHIKKSRTVPTKIRSFFLFF